MALKGTDQVVVYGEYVNLKSTKTGANNLSVPYTIDDLKTEIGGNGTVDRVAIYDSNGRLESNAILSIEGQTVINKGTYAVDTGLNTAPASATAPGVAGHIKFTADAIYLCVADNEWKKADISTF
jgi:hypothetical protein